VIYSIFRTLSVPLPPPHTPVTPNFQFSFFGPPRKFLVSLSQFWFYQLPPIFVCAHRRNYFLFATPASRAPGLPPPNPTNRQTLFPQQSPSAFLCLLHPFNFLNRLVFRSPHSPTPALLPFYSSSSSPYLPSFLSPNLRVEHWPPPIFLFFLIPPPPCPLEHLFVHFSSNLVFGRGRCLHLLSYD